MASRLGSDAQLKVTPTDLQTKSASVKSLSAQMLTHYNELQQVIQRSAAYWTGEGGNAHRSMLDKQRSDVEEMFKRINEHVVDLLSMAGVYTTTEEDIKSVIQDSLPSDVII